MNDLKIKDYFKYVENEFLWNIQKEWQINCFNYTELPEDYKDSEKYEIVFNDERFIGLPSKEYLFNALNAYFEYIGRDELTKFFNRPYNISLNAVLCGNKDDEFIKINIYVWREKDEC